MHSRNDIPALLRALIISVIRPEGVTVSATMNADPTVPVRGHAHDRPAVVFVVVGGLPLRHVGADTTPTLDRLRGGCQTVAPAMSVLTSSAAANQATFSTGLDPSAHGIVTQQGAVAAAAEGRAPAAMTLFEACRRGGRTSVGVLADPVLRNLMGVVDPPDRRLPANDCDPIRRDEDHDAAAVTFAVEELGSGQDLLVLRLDGSLRVGQRSGPDSREATSAYRRADTAVRRVIDAMKPYWSNAVLIVVSDHDQIPVSDDRPIDLTPAIDRIARATGEQPHVVLEGDAAIMSVANMSPDHRLASAFDELPGIEGRLRLSASDHLVWAPRGRVLTVDPRTAVIRRGVHGGPYTRSQVAIITGGHPSVAAMRSALERRPVRAADWAPTIAHLIGLSLPAAIGFSLIDAAATPQLRASA